MSVDISLANRRQIKRWNFERKMLRELSLRAIKAHVHMHFPQLFSSKKVGCSFIESTCVDMAIDAYLLGAEYSRFDYYGETKVAVRNRCKSLYDKYVAYLYDQLKCWQLSNDTNIDYFSLCDNFVEYWWEKGFQEGRQRYRMKLT